MGYHYFNKELVDDVAVDVLKPEVLVYAPGPDGQRKLVAVEWVVPGPISTDPAGVSEAPTMFGMDMHILVPTVGLWLMHAWVWKPNPAGMLADWNPEVSCPRVGTTRRTALSVLLVGRVAANRRRRRRDGWHRRTGLVGVQCAVKDGQLDAFKELMEEMVAGTSEEPGTLNSSGSSPTTAPPCTSTRSTRTLQRP